MYIYMYVLNSSHSFPIIIVFNDYCVPVACNAGVFN